ncbi:DUF6364 family protein [Gracilimonas mengyeensis]|uniref:Ribbon-helix-helix protein, copG family n=1 Tax=Gracilimonas mengyeensis TaxID=1302730 RepID=A0A521BU50_9BACT|nr:DUF6364 family protein [Gracilimonas mengyeensis]SMO50724.1 hypothetical protein SAMN06265219_103100 [Gracilimonas mengyeensis]
MKKKLTLTIDKQVTERAKRLAKSEGTSVSEMVENYLAEKTKEAGDWEPRKNSWTSKLLGSVVMEEKDQEEDYKTIKQREILKKHGA